MGLEERQQRALVAQHLRIEARVAAHARGRERVGELRDGAQRWHRHLLLLNWHLVANGRAARQRVHEEVDGELGAGGEIADLPVELSGVTTPCGGAVYDPGTVVSSLE